MIAKGRFNLSKSGGDNYYDAKLADGEWMHDKYEDCYEFSLKEVIAELDK